MSDTELESTDDFRARLRAWLPENMPVTSGRRELTHIQDDETELAGVAEDRRLQRILFDGGFAGLCFPKEYGGQGLTPAHAEVFNEEITGYAYPSRMQVPTMTPCAAVILEFGTHEQKLEHIPAILKGERIFMQFLSEPGSGSDVAGATTTAVRDGDDWVINGSKIWTTGAWWADWGLCLARTDPDLPKHRGLSVFMLPIHQEGITVSRIEMLNGNKEFCQEFMTDVRVPDSQRVGAVNDGWTVGTRWMVYERTYHSSPLAIHPKSKAGASFDDGASFLRLARHEGTDQDPRARERIGRGHVVGLATGALSRRLGKSIAAGILNDQAGTIGRLMTGVSMAELHSIAFGLTGRSGVVWSQDDRLSADRGNNFLLRQNTSIAGGTTEMARNVVSERVLGMPREIALDRNVAFRDIPRAAKKS
jgi:alkylation response protein AidB-like acyl-CoA dehydrogenase